MAVEKREEQDESTVCIDKKVKRRTWAVAFHTYDSSKVLRSRIWTLAEGKVMILTAGDNYDSAASYLRNVFGMYHN